MKESLLIRKLRKLDYTTYTIDKYAIKYNKIVYNVAAKRLK